MKNIEKCLDYFSINYNLIVNVNPPQSGNVYPNSGVFPENQQISIQASASPQYVFENWSGDEVGTSPGIIITMDDNKTLNSYDVIGSKTR